MANKTTEDLYGEMQNSYTKTAEKITSVLNDLQTKHKVPRKTIQNLMDLYDSYHQFNLLIQMYDIHRTANTIK